MTRPIGVWAALTMALCSASTAGYAAPADEQAARSLRFFLGTWNCAHHVGDFSGTYTTAYSPALGGGWLKQTYDFPPSKAEPADHAEYFLRYDDRFRGWVRFGAHSNGMYFGMRFKGPADTTSWKYDYVLPGANAEATWTKKSDTEYTVDGPSYPENGKTVTEHHVCTKAPAQA